MRGWDGKAGRAGLALVAGLTMAGTAIPLGATPATDAAKAERASIHDEYRAAKNRCLALSGVARGVCKAEAGGS